MLFILSFCLLEKQGGLFYLSVLPLQMQQAKEQALKLRLAALPSSLCCFWQNMMLAGLGDLIFKS